MVYKRLSENYTPFLIRPLRLIKHQHSAVLLAMCLASLAQKVVCLNNLKICRSCSIKACANSVAYIIRPIAG